MNTSLKPDCGKTTLTVADNVTTFSKNIEKNNSEKNNSQKPITVCALYKFITLKDFEQMQSPIR